MATDQEQVTDLLKAMAGGDDGARDRLIPILHKELRALAGHFMKRERADHTLQPTALVNEAVLRFYDQRQVPTAGKRQLMGLLAELMRRVLVDHARAKRRLRRGGGETVLTFMEEAGDGARSPVDVLHLDLVLAKLEQLDPRQAKVVELRVFAGLEVQEVSEVMDLSPATIKREWRTAKIWLRRELDRG